MEQEPVRDQLETALQGEHRGEEIVKLAQDLVDGWLGLEWIFTGQEGGWHKDTNQDKVGADGVSLNPKILLLR